MIVFIELLGESDRVISGIHCKWMPFDVAKKIYSSIGRVFGPPLWWWWKMAALPLPAAILDDLISASGNEVIQDGDRKWRVAIFHHHHNRGPKTRPKSWLTSFPAPPSWIQDGGATSNVWRTSRRPWRHPWKGVALVQKRHADVWLYWKHMIVSLPQPFSKWLRELPACHYGEVDQSAHVESCEKPSTSASTYSTFFGFYFILFF